MEKIDDLYRIDGMENDGVQVPYRRGAAPSKAKKMAAHSAIEKKKIKSVERATDPKQQGMSPSATSAASSVGTQMATQGAADGDTMASGAGALMAASPMFGPAAPYVAAGAGAMMVISAKDKREHQAKMDQYNARVQGIQRRQSSIQSLMNALRGGSMI